jgi:hypothetical protein
MNARRTIAALADIARESDAAVAHALLRAAFTLV